MTEEQISKLLSLFTRRWDCRVVSSGYFSGDGCTPKDPHDPSLWKCGYRWRSAPLTDKEAREIGLITHKESL